MQQYVKTSKQLHRVKQIPFKTPHISQWLETLDRVSHNQLPDGLLENAKSLSSYLLKTLEFPIFIHGDLHLDNILKHNTEYLVIDPKGIVADQEFEYAAFDFIDEKEVSQATSDLFLQRIQNLSDMSDLSYTRLRDWTFIRLILSAIWFIEDNLNPEKALFLAKLLKKRQGA